MSCVSQLRVQIWRPVEDTWYTLDVLSDKWGVSRGTIQNWLGILRRSRLAPQQGQTRRTGPNCAVRYLRIRHDYAAIIRGVFIDRTLKL